MYKTRWNSDSYFCSVGNGQGAGAGGGAGGPGGGDGGGAAGGGQGNGQNSGPGWEQFEASIRGMVDGFGQRLEEKLGTRLDNLNNTVTTGFTREEEPPDPNAGFDFDAATNRQMYDHMMNQFHGMMEQMLEGVMERALTPFNQRVTELQTNVFTDQGQRQIADAQSKYKDFNDWGQEMMATAKTHPSLSIPQLYHLVRAENGEKAKKLDTKYAPPPKEAPRPFAIGPGSRSVDSSGQPVKPMNKQEAALDAWNQVQERHPGVLPALEGHFGVMVGQSGF